MRRFVAAIVAGWATATAALSTAHAEEKPAVICESDASGRAMSCREAWPGEDAPPFRRIAPGMSSPTGAPAKPSQPLLATPSPRTPQATPAPDYLRSERQIAAQPANVAPAADTKPESSMMSKPAASSIAGGAPVVSAAPQAASAPAQRATPIATLGTAATVTEPEPPAVAEPSKRAAKPDTAPHAAPMVSAPSENAVNAAPVIVSRSPAPSATPPIVEPIPAAAPEPQPATTVSTATTAPTVAVVVGSTAQPESAGALPAAVELLGNREFAVLAGNRYTLELANAPTAAPLRALAARLGLVGTVYLIHLRNPDADRWLLTWSDHASQVEARAARLLVPADAAINSAWPRRLAPLQNELVSP